MDAQVPGASYAHLLGEQCWRKNDNCLRNTSSGMQRSTTISYDEQGPQEALELFSKSANNAEL